LKGDTENRQKAGTKKSHWGLVIAERKSKRNLGDNKTATEKAQDMKRKWEDSTRGEFGKSSVEDCLFGTELENSVPWRQARRSLGVYFEVEAVGIKTGETRQLTPNLVMENWSLQIKDMENLLGKEEAIQHGVAII
ncbi:unnamed protein product, partial [Urochloa humidicola]